jgi:hypothetical protein
MNYFLFAKNLQAKDNSMQIYIKNMNNLLDLPHK